MLASHLKTTDDLTKVQAKIQRALDHLQTLDLQSHADGRFEIDGNDIYYMISEYETLPESDMRFEAHQKYLDIQGIISGHEAIQVARTDLFTVATAYDETKDIVFFNDIDLYSTVVLSPGDYVVLMPEDAHKPKVMVGQPEHTKKYVVKIRI